MKKEFTLDYWMDHGWYVVRLREAPDVFSQGKTFEELHLNIKDAFNLMRHESPAMPVENFSSSELSIEVS